MYLMRLLPFNLKNLKILKIAKWLTPLIVLILFFDAGHIHARNIEANDHFCSHSKLAKTSTKKLTTACSISVINVTEQNCTGAGTYSAEWSIDISYADNPAGDIMIQRGTETPVAFATSGVSPESFTLTGVPADGMADAITVYFANEVACTNTFYLNRPLACPTSLAYPVGDVCANLQPSEIGGTVFYDSNYDGTYELGSVNGVVGVAITAYNNKGTAVATSYSDNNGNYVFTGMTDESYRIEFVLPTALSSIRKVTHNGAEDRTTVQFKRPGDCASLGLTAPADFCDGVPWIAVPCYNYGARAGANAGGDAFVTFPIDTIDPSIPATENMLSMPNVRHLATHEDVGVTYGVAYSQTRQAIYTSAYMKRHAAFGPDGTGAIYAIDPSGNKQTTTLVDLNVLFGAGTAGVNPHDYVDGEPCPGSTGGITDCWFNDVGADSLSWYAVGRVAFGDIEITDDENTLYAMNMANRSLYKIPLDNPTAANIEVYPFPLDQDTDPNVTHTCGDPTNSIRPMGLAWKDGKLYAGATCTDFQANTSAPYEGGSVIYVYEFDPINETWVLVLNSDIQRNAVEKIYKWRDYSQDYYANPGDKGKLKSFMILSDIEFEGDTMVIGTRDVAGDLLGYNTGFPVPDLGTLEKYHCRVGDILRTCPQVDGTWKIENSADCAGGGINNPANPCPTCGIEGLGSYYYGDWINNVYTETSLGGLANWPGSEKIFMANFDPLDISLTQGMSILNHRTGAVTQGYNLGATDFGKVAGLGDIEMICAPAPLMIGNRIWLDQNGDGIQTPGEPGVGGIVVDLFLSDGTQMAQVKTDANGYYYFKDENLTVFNNGKLRLLNPSTDYYVAIGNGQFNTTTETLLNNYKLTSINTGEGSYPTMNDSDGAIATGVNVSFNGYPYAAVTTGVDGSTENSLDFGFVPLRTIGDYVWVDEDGDGDQDRGEPGIPGVKINLKNQGGTLLASTYTDMNGEYIFRDIANGTYTVELDETTLPPGLDNQTFDPDGTLDAEHTISATSYFEYLHADFGYNWVSLTATDNPSIGYLGSIGDFIWHDVNGDGIWNPGEHGIPNVEIALYKDNDLDGVYTNLVTSVQTDSYGRYIIENLPTGAYVILVDDSTLPTGYTTTPTGDPDQDNNNRSLPFVLAPGDVLLTLDFGYQNPISYAVSGNIFIDLNAGGSKDAGEPAVAKVTVKLMNNSGDVIATTMADANGDYSFNGLSNGNYTIMVTDINTVLNGFTNSADPDAGTVNEAAVVVNSADVVDQNFGYVPEGHTSTDAIIGNFVFLDMNANGSHQTNEPGLEGITISLIDGADNKVLATTETNENGQYFFGGLVAADYKVALVSASLSAGLVPAYDPDGSAPVDFESALVSLVAGTSNLLQDFGVKVNIANTINGTVWEDNDAEGDLDESNTGIANVTVVLMDTFNNIVATTTTSSTGDYSFIGLPNGTYLIDVTDEAHVLNGYWHSTGTTPTADNNSQSDTYKVRLVNGAVDQTGDFGYYQRGASLGNFVWSDRNSDGLQDENEKGVEGAVLTLKIDYDGNGTTEVSMVTTSDISGSYRFDNLLLDEDYNKADVAGPAFELQMTMPSAYSGSLVDVNANANDTEDSENHTGIDVDPRQGTTDVSLKADPTTEDVPATYDFGLQFDCSTPTVEYAMSLDATTDAGQTTDYFYMDSTELESAGMSTPDGLPSSNGGHVALTQQYGRIQSNDYCEYGTWRYYYNPQDVNEYLFAVEMGTNVTEIDYIEIRLDDNSTDRHVANANDATYVMKRDWKLKTVNDAPFLDAVGDPATINIRFYFPPNEYKEMLDAAIAQAIAWPADGGTPNSTHVRWFRKTTFNPDADIDVTASNLLPYNVTTMRTAASSNAGINTADNTATIGNAKNHIQLDGMDMPSGGTAMIQINRTALPVELISFEGVSEGCDVMLNWRAGSELNFSHYELERSTDGARFEFVEAVEGREGIDLGYHYFDKEAAPRNYYRLKMVDVDGKFEYSNIVIVETDCNDIDSDWMIYPNPLFGQNAILNVKFYTERKSVRMSIINGLQQEVKALELDVSQGWNTLEWDMSELPAGAYYIRNSRAEGGKSYKFVLVK